MKKRNTNRSNRRTREHRKLENELTRLERDLLEALQQRLERARSVSSNDPTEFMDIVSDSEADEFAARIAESDSAKIREIEEALRKLREGNYGVCEECGQAISKRRLQARPFATMCIGCKEELERTAPRAALGVSPSSKSGAVADVGVGEREDSGPSTRDLVREAEKSGIM